MSYTRSLSFLGLALLLSLAACGGESRSSSDSDEAPIESFPTLTLASDDQPVASDPSTGELPMLIGARHAVRLGGLRPGEEVTINAQLRGWSSHATFAADASGAIDTSRLAPIHGSYRGADVDGLFWSMVRDPAAAAPGTEVSAVVRGETLRLRLKPGFGGVSFTRVTEPDASGFVARGAVPAGERRPALLVLHGSEGNTFGSAGLAGVLARHGYVAFAPLWFGGPGQPTFVDEVPVESFGRMLAWLRAQPDVDPDRVGVVGTSRGGEGALVVGSLLELRAVVGLVPSGVALGFDGRSSWTFGGAPVPFMTTNMDDVTTVTLPDGRQATRQASMYAPALANADAVAHAEIPVERVRGPVLLLGGEDDGLWPSCDLARIAFRRLERTGHARNHEDEIVCYPKAGHGIGLPGSPTTENWLEHPLLDVLLTNGGTPDGTAHAQRAALDKIVGFLDAAMRR